MAITGGNGSGKSTLTRLINAELRPDRGQIVVNGIDVASRTPVQMAQQVAVVGQHPADMFWHANNSVGSDRRLRWR